MNVFEPDTVLTGIRESVSLPRLEYEFIWVATKMFFDEHNSLNNFLRMGWDSVPPPS